jgi:hypothetical protein
MPDSSSSSRTRRMEAVLQMKKLDIDELHAAANNG